MAFAEGERKTIGSCGKAAISRICGMNRRLAAGKLAIDFKNPWNYLAEMPAEASGEAASEATNQLWWCLLEKVRTHFEQNPD